MLKSLFTHDQFEDLKKEFVEFYINDMNTMQMKDWISTVYLAELDKCTEDDVKEEIDRYDEHLYELLEDYVTETVGSYTALQEFIHDRHANDWIDS